VCFLDGDDRYEGNFLEEAVGFLEGHRGEADFAAAPIYYFGAGSGGHVLNRGFGRAGVADIEVEWASFVHNVSAVAIRAGALGALRFNEALSYLEDGDFLTRLALEKGRYGRLATTRLWYRRRASGDSAVDASAGRAAWYEKIETVHAALIEHSMGADGAVPRYVQNLIAYDLQWYRVRDVPEAVVGAAEMKRLRAALARVLSHIEDDVVMGQRESGFWDKIGLLKLKHGGARLHERELEMAPFFSVGQVRVPFSPAVVQIVEEYGGVAHLAGFYDLPDYGAARVIVRHGGRDYASETRNFHHRRFYYLGEAAHAALHFDIYIPLAAGGGALSAFYQTRGGRLVPAPLAHAWESRLAGEAGAFAVCGTAIISRTPAPHILFAERLTQAALRRYVGRYCAAHCGGAGQEAGRAMLRRYAELFPEMSRRRIWVFMDRRERADDNAEHLFRYAAAQADGVEKYFFVAGGTPDFARVAQYGKAVPLGSAEQELLLLYAEKYISSCEVATNFPDGSRPLLRAFMRCRHVFLQHGITKDDVSAVWNRYTRNFSLFITAAEAERREVASERYGYREREVALTGFPRFDALRSAPGRVLLFMPTWRRRLSRADKGYNPDFKADPFCHALNAVFADARLRGVLRECGWEFVFKPHPELVRQLPDFLLPGHVALSGLEESYQALYETGALLVTDYSSAAFDFAYLKKPVLYYQAAEPHYEPSYFDYGSMGFGEVVTTVEALVDAVVKLMRGGCRMEEKYRRRAESFFAFADRDNCKRAYEAILGMEGGAA
jgi:CDP-glycerol glycerophosphotransferase (TagB/SpsB family)